MHTIKENGRYFMRNVDFVLSIQMNLSCVSFLAILSVMAVKKFLI